MKSTSIRSPTTARGTAWLGEFFAEYDCIFQEAANRERQGEDRSDIRETVDTQVVQALRALSRCLQEKCRMEEAVVQWLFAKLVQELDFKPAKWN